MEWNVRSKAGKFVLRIKDRDLQRSSRESKEAVLKDLSGLGLDWDEGTTHARAHSLVLGIVCVFVQLCFSLLLLAPGLVDWRLWPSYMRRRNSLYKHHAHKLLESGHTHTVASVPIRNLRK